MPVFFTVRTRGPKNARYAGDCHPGRARAPNSPRDIEMNRKTAAVTAAVVTALISIVAIHIVRGQAPEVALEVAAILTPPPLTPPPVERNRAATVLVSLETTEVKGRLANDVTYKFWTFNGTVPGPFIRVRVGDTLRIRLKNAKSSMNWHSVNLDRKSTRLNSSHITISYAVFSLKKK